MMLYMLKTGFSRKVEMKIYESERIIIYKQSFFTDKFVLIIKSDIEKHLIIRGESDLEKVITEDKKLEINKTKVQNLEGKDLENEIRKQIDKLLKMTREISYIKPLKKFNEKKIIEIYNENIILMGNSGVSVDDFIALVIRCDKKNN